MDHKSPIPRWLLLAAALVVVWLGVRWLADCSSGDDDGGNNGEDTTRERFRGPPRMLFRDGKWVPVDTDEMRAVLRDLLTRSPGLVRVSGTVRNSESGGAVAGAEVVFANEFGEASALADDQGHYQMVIQPGFFRAFARADGYVAVGMMQFERLPENQPDPDIIGLPRGELAPLLGVFRDQEGVDMHLRGGARVVGTVYDSAGRPIAGAVVTGRLTGYQGIQTRLILGTDMDESDLDGRFELEVPAGPIDVSAAHRDYAGLDPSSKSFAYLESGAIARMDLTLASGCILEGTVVDSRGELVANGSLEEWNHGPPPNDYTPVGRIESGRFRLARTFTGTVRLRAWPWKSPPTASSEFYCQDGTRYSDIKLVVPDADPDLEGTVVGADGVPIPEAYVDILPFDGFSGMAQQERADAYGEWAFYALPPGRYHALAHVPEHGVAARTVTVPGRGVTLQLSGTGSISGTARGMRDGSFTFIIGRCDTRAGDGDSDSVVTFDGFSMPTTTRLVPVDNGSFHIDDLPACTLHAVARTPIRSERVSIDITAGGIVPLVLDLRAAELKTVYGVVADGDGAPVAGVSVSRIPGEGAPADFYAYAVTDDSGRYEIDLYTGDQLFFRGSAGWGQAEVAWNDQRRERIDVTLSE